MEFLIIIIWFIVCAMPIFSIYKLFSDNDYKCKIKIVIYSVVIIGLFGLISRLITDNMWIDALFLAITTWLLWLFLAFVISKNKFDRIVKNRNHFVDNKKENIVLDIVSDGFGFAIKSINERGVVGIELGDEWKFVLNRLLHLNLINKEEFNSHFSTCYELESTFENMMYEINLKNPFQNIGKLDLYIKNKNLNRIKITTSLPTDKIFQYLHIKYSHLKDSDCHSIDIVEGGTRFSYCVYKLEGVSSNIKFIKDDIYIEYKE